MSPREASLNPRKAVVAVCATRDDLVRAVKTLAAAGFDRDHLAVLGPNAAGVEDVVRELPVSDGRNGPQPDTLADAVTPNGLDEVIGMVVGGVIGIILALAMVSIPGFGDFLLSYGPVMIALHALTLCAGGIGIGALIGAILDEQVTENHRTMYKQALEAGGWMLVVRGAPKELEHARDTLIPRVAHVDAF